MQQRDCVLPQIIFESGWLLDSSIAEIAKVDPDQSAIEEVSNRLPEFQKAWGKFGHPLLEAAVQDSGLVFKERDIKAVLICGSFSSHSHPLILNVKNYLKALHVAPRSLDEFVEVVFHELLHILLQDNVASWPTPFINQYSECSFEMTAHLHLLALERRSHDILGKDCSWLEKWYAEIGDEYAKAWRIVSNDANQSTLLAEISSEFRQPEIFM